MKYKKPLRLLLFFSGFLLLLTVCNALVDPAELYRNRQVNTRNRNYAGALSVTDPLDVLILGDSESYTSVSPLQIWHEHGIPMFNGGMAGQTIIEARSELLDTLKTQQYRIVLLETNLLFRVQDPVKTAAMQMADRIYRAFPALRFHSSWKTVFYTAQEKAQEDNWPWGFHLVDRLTSPDADEAREDFTVNSIPSRFNIAELKRLQALCESKEIQLILYSSPSPKNYPEERQAILRELSESLGIPYYNLNDNSDELELNWMTDSYDGGDHLNIAGAMKTSEYMGDILAEQYSLPDRREDPAYENWNTAAEAYHKITKKMLKKLRKKAKKM